MQKLRAYLDAHNIQWRENGIDFEEVFVMCETLFFYKCKRFSVRNVVYDFNIMFPHNDLLSCDWGENLTADDVIRKMENLTAEDILREMEFKHKYV